MAGNPTRNLNLNVQGARGLAALLVFVFHIWRAEVPTFDAAKSGAIAAMLGTFEYGVDIFFCISGFVIAGALQRAPGMGAFLRDRMIRIYPVLWPPMMVSLAHGLLFHHREFAKVSTQEVIASLPANMLALPGVVPVFLIHPPAWSLSYEMAFYVFCSLAFLLRQRIGVRMAALLWAPAAALLLIFYPRALFFAAGFLVAVAPTIGGTTTRILARFPLVMLIVMLAAWGTIQAISGPVHLAHTTLLDWALDRRLALACIAVGAAALMMRGIAEGNGVLGRPLLWGPMLALGTISYSFYLWHIPAIAITRRIILGLKLDIWAGPASQLLMFAIALPLSILFAWLSWRWIEQAFCSWLRARWPRAVRPLAANT